MACCRKTSGALALGAALLAAAAPCARALSPSEVFEKVSPSVWAVHTFDLQGRPFGTGSAVVIGPGRLITNCHVLAKAKTVQVRREGVKHEAKLEHADAERDLCTLTAYTTAPEVEIVAIARVKIGQRVYAIGNPRGLSLTLSEGLISGLRSDDRDPAMIQTSAPISPGSSGGGLFDEHGDLVGITTSSINDGTRRSQNLNFATPAEWIREVPERAKQQLARLRAQQAAVAVSAPAAAAAASPAPAPAIAIAAAPGLPATGTTWTYAFRDQRVGRGETRYSIRVASVSGSIVNEVLSAQGLDAPAPLAVDTGEPRFLERRLQGDTAVVELAPYLAAAGKLGPYAPMVTPTRYPGGTPMQWKIDRPRTGFEEEVTVPAGTFRALRVEISGTAPSIGTTTALMAAGARFSYTAWYAPDIKRYVKTRHQTWSRANLPVSDQIAQLVEYRQESPSEAPAAAALAPAVASLAPLAPAEPAPVAPGRENEKPGTPPADPGAGLIVLNLSGTQAATESADWERLRAEWRKSMEDAAARLGARFYLQEGEVRATREPGILFAVYVNRFRYVAPGTRYVFGVLTGNAHIDVKVRMLNLDTGARIDERSYNPRSRGRDGVFAAVTDRQVRAIADDVVSYAVTRSSSERE